MRVQAARQFRLALPLAVYGLLLWRMPYSMEYLPLRVLDWAVPAVGLGVWAAVRCLRREAWPRTAIDWPLFGWIAVSAWSCFFSANERMSLHSLWQVWIGILILSLLVDAIRRGWGAALWRAVYLIAGVVLILGVVEFIAWYMGWPLLPAFQQGWPAIGGLAQPIPPVIHRIGLALVNITAFSAFVSLLVPPAVCLAISARKRDTRWGSILWLAAALVIEVLSFSRGGILALGVSLPIVLAGVAFSPDVRRRWAGLIAGRARPLLAGAAVVAILGALGLGYLVATRVGLASHESGDIVRLDLWRSAATMVADHPMTGVGTGAYGTALRVYRDALAARDHIVTAHNLYLNTGAETGIPGLLAAAWLLFAIAWAWWRRWRSTTPGSAAWWQALGIGAALAGLAAQSFVDTFTEPAIVLVASLFIGVILAPGRPAEPLDERTRRWPWAIALATLVLGVAGLAWESVGSADFARSLALTARGQVDGALAAAEQAHGHDAGMPAYTCQAGYLYGRQAAAGQAGALPRALDRYQECLTKRLVPGWVEQLNLATLLWQDGQTAEAQAAIAQATDQTPREWMPWLSRGYWAESEGDWAGAAQAYGRVLALDPDLAGSPFWREAGRTAHWDEIVAGGASAVTETAGDARVWRWQVTLEAGRPDMVAPQIEEWLSAHPNDTGAMVVLGEALLATDRSEDAVRWLTKATAADRSQAAAYRLLGEGYLALGRLDEADRALRTALFLDTSAPVHLALARLAVARGDPALASTEYSRSLRGMLLIHSYDLVLDGWMSWPAPLPQALRIGYRYDGEAALEWGSLLEQQGEPDLAQQVYRSALDLDPHLDRVRERLQEKDAGPGL